MGKGCEDCGGKHAHYGKPGKKSQWCGTCAKKQEGQTVLIGLIGLIGAKMCEDCGKKHASCGLALWHGQLRGGQLRHASPPPPPPPDAARLPSLFLALR
eukprot:COSAG04_NODE_1749_length_5711_cov_7.754052_1_plen_98_part_10